MRPYSKVLLAALVLLSVAGSNQVNAQQTFDEHIDNPVFSYSENSGSFDQNRVFAHDVIKVGDGYKMFYSGVGNGNSIQIGLATSSDGINWQRNSNNPIFRCGDNASSCATGGNWSHFRVSVVSVEYKDGEYRMWYQGDNQNLSSIKRLGYAVSSDGVNWIAYQNNPIYSAVERTGIRYLSVLSTEDGYRLYYSDTVDRGYYYIDSRDGLTWQGQVVKISDELVSSVDKIGDRYVAVLGTKIALSEDGKAFDFNNQISSIDSNPGPDEARVSFLSEGDALNTWRVHYLGNVTWNYGNFAINFASAPLSIFEENLPHENKYPLYTQIESPYPSVEETAGWADDTMPCGTIATCGCAITSLVMAARAEGVTEGVDGKDVNPGNLNAWLKNNSGYSDGMLLWSKALDYFGVKDEATGKIKTPLSFTDANHNVTDTDKIGTAIAGPEHVIGYSSKVSGGHYFVVSDLLDGTYYIRDPWYYDTETLDDVDDNEEFVFDYNNGLTKANIITVKEPEVLTGFLEIILASPAELRLENELHQVTGYDENGNRFEISSASYDPQEYIGNPAEETPVEPHYAKHMMVPDAEGKYTLSVVGTGEGTYHLGISLRDSDGDEYYKRFTSSTTPGQVDEYVIDVETGEVELNEEEYSDDEGGSEIDRAAFIALVKAATVDERKLVQKFFIFEANRLFDSIEKERAKIALIRLRVFATLLKAKHINNAPLNEAIKTLEGELKGAGR